MSCFQPSTIWSAQSKTASFESSEDWIWWLGWLDKGTSSFIAKCYKKLGGERGIHGDVEKSYLGQWLSNKHAAELSTGLVKILCAKMHTSCLIWKI